jgi:hypothetical protein
VAGHETTTHLIGNGLLVLLRHKPQLQRLRREPSLLPLAVEELLRSGLSAPAEPQREVELAPDIPENSVVLGIIGAANRDPAVFPTSTTRRGARREPPPRLRSASTSLEPRLPVSGADRLGTVLRRLPRLASPRRPEWRVGPPPAAPRPARHLLGRWGPAGPLPLRSSRPGAAVRSHFRQA